MNVRAPFKPPRPLNQDGNDHISQGKSKSGTNGKPRLTSAAPTPKMSKSGGTRIVNAPKRNHQEAFDSSLQLKYVVQWRKTSNKKNKTWDGDGTITVAEGNGNTKVVTAKIDKKVITKSLSTVEGIFKIGNYELEIDCQVDNPVQAEPATRSAPTSLASAPTSMSSAPTSMSSAPTSMSSAPISMSSAPISLPSVSKSLAHSNGIPQFKKLIHRSITLKKVLYPKSPDSLVMTKLSDSDTDVIVDPSLNKVLRPHQREGVSFLYDVVMGLKCGDGTGALLADEMGLGKTLMTITLIWTLLKQSPNPCQTNVANKVLIVCPVTLISNWKREFKKWLNINQIGVLAIDSNCSDYKQQIRNFNRTKVYQVLIMSYEKLLNCEPELSELNLDLVICDEGHKLKSNSNKALKILNKLDIEKKILLTGTPIQNNLTEFFTLINFLNNGILGTFNEFQKNFIKPIENYRDPNCFNPDIIDQGRLASNRLNELTSQFILRRTNQILDNYLNTKTDVLLFVKPTSLQLKLFKSILSNLNQNQNFQSLDRDNALNLINLFKKVCNTPLLAEDDGLFKSLIASNDSNIKSTSVSSGKLNLLTLLLIEIVKVKKEKVVIISNYTKTLDVILQILRQLNFVDFLRLDGSTNSNARSSLINQFNNLPFPKCPIFLLSSKSGGFGINLIGASRLILVDNDWNPSNDLQAMSRIYRDGQLKPVFLYRLFTTGCIDEKIFQRQLMKTNLSDNFLNNSAAVKDNLNIFDTEDLKDLFSVQESTCCNTHDLLECECKGDGELFNETLKSDFNSDPDSNSNSDTNESNKENIERSSLRRSSGWMSALNYSQLEQSELNKRMSIRNALDDYSHFDPTRPDFKCSDNVVNNVIRSNPELGVSYIFTKLSNPKESSKEQDPNKKES